MPSLLLPKTPQLTCDAPHITNSRSKHVPACACASRNMFRVITTLRLFTPLPTALLHAHEHICIHLLVLVLVCVNTTRLRRHMASHHTHTHNMTEHRDTIACSSLIQAQHRAHGTQHASSPDTHIMHVLPHDAQRCDEMALQAHAAQRMSVQTNETSMLNHQNHNNT